MIENRPVLTFVSHLVLVIGVAIVALPVYITFVASTLAVDEVLQAPMPLHSGIAPDRELREGAGPGRVDAT